jgi:hypothetical protein
MDRKTVYAVCRPRKDGGSYHRIATYRNRRSALWACVGFPERCVFEIYPTKADLALLRDSKQGE